MYLTLDSAIYIDDQREGNNLASNQCMSRFQTLNICSNREVWGGQEQKTDQAIFFSIRTVKQSTSSWSPPLPYKLTQLLCSLCIPKVQLSEQTLWLQAICTSSWCKNSCAPLIMSRKTWVQSQWEQVIPEGWKTWNVWDKVLSYAGFSIPLLSFLFLLPDMGSHVWRKSLLAC
jgi:hypothetical protein